MNIKELEDKALIAVEHKDYDTAIKVYKGILKESNNEEDTLKYSNLLSDTFEKAGKLAESYTVLMSLFNTVPNDKKAYSISAYKTALVCRDKLNDKKGMLRYLNIAVALNENNTNATALLNDELKNL